VHAHRAEFTCCTARNAGYFADARVRYSSGMRCVLGFDGGGTKTDCVLMDETGALLARTQSGPSNPILVEAAQKALGSADLLPDDVRFVLAAVAGATAVRNLSQLVSKLEEKYVHAKALIDSDAKLAFGATGAGRERRDAAAQGLLRNAAEELVVLAERVIKRLRLNWENFLLARTGRVFGRSRYFDEAFERGVPGATPEARVGALPTPVAEYAAQVALLMMRGMEGKQR
jgi:hypothetical protein